MNNNLNDKNNRPNIEDELLDDVADVEIEDLSFDFKGEGTLDGNLTPDESTNEPYINNNDVSNDVATKDGLGTSSGDSNDMVDTSDDVNAGSSIGSNDNTVSDDGSEPSMYDSSKSDTLPQDDMIDTSDDIGDASDTLNNSDETNDSSNNKKKDDSGSDDSGSNNKEKSNSENDPEKKTSDDNQKDSNGTDKEKKSDSKDNPESNNDKKGNSSENKKGADNNSNPDQNGPKSSNQDNGGKSNTSKDNANKKPDKPKKTQDEKDKDKASRKMGLGNNKYANKANNYANKTANRANKAADKAKKAEAAAKKAEGTKRAARASRKATRAGKRAARTAKTADRARKVASTITKFSKTLTIIKLVLIAVLVLVILIFAVINAFGAVVTPGQGSDIKDEFSGFSENDKKILEEVNGINGISKPNAELAIYTVLFPYFESLQDGAIDSYLNDDSSELDEEEQQEYDENSSNSETRQKILESFGCEDLCQELLGEEGVNQIIKAYAKKSLKTRFKEFFGLDTSEEELDLDDLLESEEEESDDSNAIGETDDPYLKLLSKSKYQKRLQKLLENLSSTAEEGDYSSEEVYFNYLKETYFESDAGYKALLIQSDDTEALKDAIIEQLKAGASLYEVYIADHCVTSNASLTPLNSAGNINNEIQGDIYIRLRDYRDTGGYWVPEDHFDSPILYGTDTNPLPFARYIMGVAYAEIGDGVKVESIAKTIMVTAKSYTVGRYKSMGDNYPKPEVDQANNRTIIEMRGNVGDQDFCDVYEGCSSGTYAWSTRTEMRGSGDPKGPLNSQDLANLEKWWNEIADVYVINSSTGNFAGNQYEDYNDNCKKGSCVSQTAVEIAAKKESDYMNILFNANNGGFDGDSYQVFNASTGGVYAVSTGSKFCTPSNINAIRQQIVDFAISMVGKIPYYFYEGQSDGKGALGHAISKNYDDNHFNEEASLSDHKGRNKYGLDCSGFVDFVFWNVLDDNLGNGNTTTLRNISTKLSSSTDLLPGDLGFLSDEGSGTNQHVGIYIGNNEWVELNPNGVTKGEYPNFKVFYRPNILAELDQQYGNDVILTGSTVYENPIPGQKITNAYGVKGSLWSRGYHTGSDFGGGTNGMEIHSIGEGTVYCINCMADSFGNHVVVEHADGYYSLYAHMSSTPKVSKGQKVNHSTILGNVGSTGNVTGPHLHLEFWKGVPWKEGSQDLNPANYIIL